MDQHENMHNACDDDSVIRRLGVLAERSEAFKEWVLDQLQSHNSRRILDAACGTGGDSLFLVEKGFQVVSSDCADAMLHYARQARDSYQSQDKGLANWDIENANWLSLKKDLSGYGKFDAVLCLGSSMITLLDPTPNFDLYRRSFENFKGMLKPGGVLLIDHRNMDAIIDHGVPINKHVYFKENAILKMSSDTIKSTGTRDPINITFDMAVSDHTLGHGERNAPNGNISSGNRVIEKAIIPLQPIRAREFETILGEVFGARCDQTLGDLKAIGTITDPAYYQYVIGKTNEKDQ